MEGSRTTVIEYGRGIYAIDQQMVRAFLIVGKQRALLLDTGAMRADIPSIIKGITELPVTVVLTHGDGDHIGNLQDFPIAYAQEKDMAAISSHENCTHVELLPISAGDEIDLGEKVLKVLYTPGHTPGSICLLDAEGKLLFSGDTVSYGPVFMFGARRNMRQYLESLQRLSQMKDDGVFTTVYCCHNTCPIPADTVDDLIACVQGVQEGTITGVPAPMPIPTEDKPLLCKYANCALLIEAK